MSSMAIDGFVPTDTCVSNFFCDTDLNGEAIFDAVIEATCEWTFEEKP